MSYTQDDLYLEDDENEAGDDVVNDVPISDTSEIRATIEDLTTTINLANQAYLFTNHPIMDDTLYDEYAEELKRLEDYYPQYKSPNSPNDKLAFRKGSPTRIIRVERTYKDPAVIQLDSHMAAPEVVTFIDHIQSTYNSLNTMQSLNAAPKPIVHINHSYKSIPVILVYKEGRLFHAVSRGDGQSGADLTHSVSTIINVPIMLNAFETEPYPDGLIIRGDIVMPSKSYKRYVSDMTERGEYLDDSIRAMNRILYHEDNSLMIKYPLAFLAREVLMTDPGYLLESLDTYTSSIEYMEMLGFHCLPTRIVECDLNTVMDNINQIYNLRSTFAYPLLGVSIRVDNVELQESMQAELTQNTRAWELKLLYPMRRLIMRVDSINWTLDEHDSIVPLFYLTDTTNNQTQITRLTNLNELLRHVVSVGDIIDCLVRGADDLIEITHIVNHHNSQTPIAIIDHCPSCKTLLIKRETQYMCANQLCKDKLSNIVRRYLAVNDKDSIALPLETRDTILTMMKMPHPIELFSEEKLKELLDELTKLLSERTDITLQPDVTASQFLTNVIPHPTLNIADLLCILGVTDSVNTVFTQRYGLNTLRDLFAITEVEIKVDDFLKQHEFQALLRLVSNTELLAAVKRANIDHPLIM